jgi:hypothetical protein
MPKVVGLTDSLALITDGSNAVVLDTDFNIIVEGGSLATLQGARKWESTDYVLTEELETLTASALAIYVQSPIVAAGARKYTIPKAAQAEAVKALKWRKEHKRGGTPVGLNTARTLAKGGQIGIEKVRHIAKYFPRHEVDKKGKGWSPGEDNFPSNGRIAWALWGGNAAWRWAADIVETENNKKKALKASGLSESESVFYKASDPLESFKEAYTFDVARGPEFVARVRMDGSGIDRLYKVDVDGRVYVWDDGIWEDLASLDGDVWTYDKALDDPYDTVEKSHIEIDPESAIIIAARLEQSPHVNISIFDIDRDEAELMAQNMTGVDWAFMDKAIIAAGESFEKASTSGDGIDTPEERAERAASQARDAFGKFIPSNGRVTIGGDPRAGGTSSGLNPDGTLKVKLDNGNEINVDPKLVQNEGEGGQAEEPNLRPTSAQSDFDAPLDTSGILGEPRTPIDQPKAHLPGTLPPMSAKDLHDVLYNWDTWVREQRESFKPDPMVSSAEEPKGEHELLKKLKRKKTASESVEADEAWAKPVFATEDDSEPEREVNPDTSDVQPLYMVIVAEDDPRAVLDLVALVPASNKSTAPMTYRRADQKWVRAENILIDMKSATPPPTIALDDASLQDVLKQVDGVLASAGFNPDQAFMVLWGPSQDLMSFIESSITAAGGADRNRGNAEELRRYWTRGKGAAKIRWGTGGDWTRCVRQLSKYLGTRAKGYCALRHKEMNGVWPGDKRNRQLSKRKRGLTSSASFSNESLNATNHVIELTARDARIQDAKDRISGVTASVLDETGARFSIPLVIPEGIESGDGRKFRKGSITMRELPLPLLWQIKTSDGHMGSVVVGRIDRMERTENGIGNAFGVFDSGVYGKEAERLVRNGFIRGVSADMDQFEAEEAKEASDSKDVKKDKLVINKARVMAATIVPKPAFQECQIFLSEEEPTTLPQEDIVIPDGVYAEEVDPADAAAIVACGYVAGAIPLTPPTEWFDNPKLTKATPLTVTDDGKVFGHIAAWHVDHIGMAGGTKPPRSKSKYAYFHSGVIRTTDGTDVPVGQLTLAGGHAPLHASAQQAAKHYDDTASAFADVHAGEDAYGIWVSGSLRPGITPEQVRAVRASAPSGDWRPIRGSLELVAVCQVNVPGFPIARAMVASGQVMALVAAGAQVLAKMKSDPLTELNERLARLETFTTAELNTRSESAKALFAEVKAQKNAELSARVSELSSKIDAVFSYDDEFANISRRERKSLAQEGKALPDGSFPIRNEDDLKNAIQAYGRAKQGKRAAVRNFIIKRARQLKRSNLVPQEWKDAANAEFNSKIDSMRLTASVLSAVVAAPVEMQPILDENGQPMLDDNGNPIMGNPTPTPTPTPQGDVSGKADAVEPVTPEEITDNPDVIDVVDKSTDIDGQMVDGKYVPGKTQPRDEAGKFRKVLARLRQNLGVAGLQNIVEEAKYVEGLHEVGNYTESANAAGKLLDIVDRLDSGALNKVSLENVRSSAAELGKVISNLPLGFGDQTKKLKYSDLPPALSNLMDDMIERVENKIGKEDADIATEGLRAFKSGSEIYSQAEISSQMSKLLRLLT